MHFVRKVFALKCDFSLAELEQAVVNMEALHQRPDSANGNALASDFKRGK